MFKKVLVSVVVLLVVGGQVTILQATAGSSADKNQKSTMIRESQPANKKSEEQTQTLQPTLLWKKTFDNEILSYSISSDGSRIVVVAGKQIYWFNKNGEKLGFYYVDNPVSDVRISENGSYTLVQTMIYLAPNSDSIDYHLLFFNQNGKLLWNKSLYEEFDMSEDGNYVVSSDCRGASNTILLNKNGETIWNKENIAGSPRISSDGKYITVGGYLLDQKGNILWRKDEYEDPSISPNGNYVALFSYDELFSSGSVKIYFYTKNGDLVWTKEVAYGGWAEFSPDSNYLLVCIDGTGFYFYRKEGTLSWQKLGDYRFWEVNFTILFNNDVILITPIPMGNGLTFTCVDTTGITIWQFNLLGIRKACISGNGRYIVGDDGSKAIYLYELYEK